MGGWNLQNELSLSPYYAIYVLKESLSSFKYKYNFVWNKCMFRDLSHGHK